MARQPTRSLLITLIVALQLVLQPLAAASMCMGADGGGSCCCSPELESAGEQGGGCCESESLPKKTSGAGVASHSGCGCIATPGPLPTTPPESSDLQTRGDGSEVVAHPASQSSLFAPPAAARIRLLPPRDLPLRGQRALHLLIQVFLI